MHAGIIYMYTHLYMHIYIYIYTLRDRRIPYHSVTYHLNLAVGHKVHLLRHTFVIAQLFRENKQQCVQKTPTEKITSSFKQTIAFDMMRRVEAFPRRNRGMFD